MVTFEAWVKKQPKEVQDDRKEARKAYVRLFPSVDSEVVEKLRKVRPDHDETKLQKFLDQNI